MRSQITEEFSQWLDDELPISKDCEWLTRIQSHKGYASVWVRHQIIRDILQSHSKEICDGQSQAILEQAAKRHQR